MDVQTENTDPPPCETQSSGKIRKGFKLFGKRKPGNIFSIRNNKSPVKSGKTLDGLSETAAPDSEQESEKEKRHEGSQGEKEQAEEEPLSEDGVLAAAPARTSISSASSAKSLSFLSLLRGGRRGVGEHRAHTLSQPVGRQRRGLKGLFGNVKFLSRDKEDKEEAPPSPLLMSSRANSVEIIKEDLTLTPKSQPRSLGSPVSEPIRGVTTQDSSATSPSDAVTPQATASNVSSTNEHVPPLPDSEPPLMPGDNSLSSLLADISSLLTFDSISGGDIMADVEAEWGKASSAISAVVTEVTSSSTSLFSKPSISSPLTSTSVSTAVNLRPSPVASTQSSTPLTKTSLTSSPISKPSPIITTLTKSSTLTTPSVRVSSDSAQASTSTTPVILTSFSAPKTSSPSVTAKFTLSTFTTTAAPPNTPATVVKVPSVSQTLTSTVSKPAPETAAPPQVTPSVSKPSPVAPPAPVKPQITPSPPTPTSTIQHPPIKSHSSGGSAPETSTSYKPFLGSVAAESKAPAAESLVCTATTKPSPPAPVFPSKMTTAPTSTTTSSTLFSALSKPPLTSSPVDINRMTPSLAAVPDLPSTFTSTTKTQPSPASVSLSSTSFDKTPPAYKPPPVPAFVDKAPPAPTTTPAPVSYPGVSIPSQTPPALSQTPISQSKGPYTPVQVSGSKDPPAPAPMHVSQAKAPPSFAQLPVSVSKDLPAPVTLSKAPSAQAQIPISASKDAPVPAPAQIPFSVIRDPPAPVLISVSKDAPAPIQGFVSKDASAPLQIQLSQSKAPSAPAPAPCPVSSSSLSSPPSSQQSVAFMSAKTRGSEQASVDGKLSSPSSIEAPSFQMAPDKTTEQHSESHASLPREKRTPQAKPSGLSKIPVVGGGRAGRIPVREGQHVDDGASRDPPTPVLEEERLNFNSHDAGSKDKIKDVEVAVPTSKHSQEESQQQKALTSLPRDSKIPVKHGASQIPLAKEPQRTKIPVSKVPVRRSGAKPAASGGSAQMRK